MSHHYHLKNIRTLLNEGFTAEELQRLCYEESIFRPVYDQLSQYSGKADILDRLCGYAGQKLQFEILLAWAKEHNPVRYEKHQPYYLTAPAPPQASEEIQDASEQNQRQLAETMRRDKAAAGYFDVFLCHNSVDKAAVWQIRAQLKARSILPWESRPGLPWQRLLEAQIEQIKSVAVFAGQGNKVPWQNQELDAFLREFVELGCPVIPVLLPQASCQPELPLFLKGIAWIDFRQPDPDPLAQLIWGITGWFGR